MTTRDSTPLEVLSRYWGYDSFRALQPEIIDSVLEGRDTLGLLPTGGGKSITFQVPGLMLEGVTLVVTPLISLMKDQVDNLARRGVGARMLHSGMTPRENRLAIDSCRYGKSRFLYVSPEKLQSPNFIDTLRQLDVALIVVDEAHCISQWGYDFRPSYLKIGELRSHFPAAAVLALTATATPEVAADIMKQLRFTDGRMFAKSFARDNLSYIVRYVENKEGKLIDMLRRTRGSTIVYVRSRRRSRELAEALAKAGIPADFYHAGLAVEDKNERQNRWKQDATRVIVATNAFGMGIDKPDVRYVVHYDLPSSLEEYYQEAGRAGRDGEPSFAVVLASKADKATLTRRLHEAFPDKDYIRHVYEMAGNFLNVAVEEGYNRMFEFNFELFCERFDLKAAVARNALMILTRCGYIEFVDEITTRSRVMITASKDELYGLEASREADSVLQTILRLYTGLFADYVNIDESTISRRCDIAEHDVYMGLLELQRLRVLHYIPKRRTPYLFYTTSRELPRYLAFPRSVYEDMRERMERRVEAMKRFVYSTTDGCRVKHMLRYFGEVDAGDCGRCDICRERASKPGATEATVDSDVAAALEGSPGLTVDELSSATGHSTAAIVESLRRLIARGRATRVGSSRFS